jgi:hypothetical protein
MQSAKKQPNLPYVSPPPLTITKGLIPNILPHEKIYTIQVGGEKFILSGASLSYDSPSYFTDYFLEHPNLNELSIDRSPKVFQKIYMHLQGYSIKIEDEYEFLYLLVDSNYLRLKKLKERMLLEPLIICVGGKQFKIHRETLSQKGNYPNYFSIIYNTMLQDPYTTHEALIRPLPVSPYVSVRSAEIFEQLLFGLQGNKIEIKNENHRKNLLDDCRYYQFFALEQEIINHKILRNPFTGSEEIVIGYKDIKKSGLLNDTMNSMIDSNAPFTVIKYSRPYVDENTYRDLILQIDSTEVNLMVNVSVSFSNLLIVDQTANKLKNILSKVTDDYIFENQNGVDKLTVLIQMNESVGTLNGLPMENGWLDTLIKVNNGDSVNQQNITMNSSQNDGQNQSRNKIIVVKLLKSQWTINVQGRNKVWMNCLKFDGVLDKSHFNEKREFL